jgi:hypothetical protein
MSMRRLKKCMLACETVPDRAALAADHEKRANKGSIRMDIILENINANNEVVSQLFNFCSNDRKFTNSTLHVPSNLRSQQYIATTHMCQRNIRVVGTRLPF